MEPVGQLEVCVVDDVDELPIPGVTVSVAGDPKITLVTDIDGCATTTLPAGVWEIAVSKAEFSTITVAGIPVTAGRTWLQALELRPKPSSEPIG